ncbi:ATP-binding cassette domain-containing protein, partial [Klebsiella pneumoniae]|uniref:ATP-binding cassette domain-containing protein n=1 Tax=Klebsiella pneumoniae TaxID=573 RepID=UPI0035204DFD
MTALLELRDIRRSYPSGDGSVEVLKGITLSIHAGEMVAIVGASGSGKSTLMNILGCLDKPTSGTYRVAGTDIAQLDGDALARLRREHFGFIFQRYHLLSHLTAADGPAHRHPAARYRFPPPDRCRWWVCRGSQGYSSASIFP